MTLHQAMAALCPALACLVSTGASATDPVAAQDQPNPASSAAPSIETQTEVVEGMADRYNRMTVPVTIEGQGPFHFMIDTGAQATVVTRGLTEKLDLKPVGAATIIAMGSVKPVQMVRLDGLEFAQRVLDDIDAPMLEERHVGADGILGLDSLQDMRVLIDFRSDTIAVDTAEQLGGNKGYEIVVRARHRLGRLIITSADIDGVKTSIVLDTGAQGSFGNDKLKQRLRARKLDAVSSTDVHGATFFGQRHLVDSLRIQDIELTNVPITFADSPAFAALGLDSRPALILGMRDLRLFDRVAIDFASRRVLFDVPTGTGLRQQRYNRNFGSRLP